jgi:hypothetical protein
MATMARNLSLLLAAARAGRLGAPGAKRWAEKAARGQDISIVAHLSPGGPGMAPAAVSELAGDLAQILTVGGRGSLSHDDISDAEADALWPAKTTEEAEERRRTIEAAGRQLRELDGGDLYGLIWPDDGRWFASGSGDES